MKKYSEAVAERRLRVGAMHDEGYSVASICFKLGLAANIVQADLRKISAPTQLRFKRPPNERVDAMKVRLALKGRNRVIGIRDRRRFKHINVPSGEAAKLAPLGITGTIHSTKVLVPAILDNVLKDGAYSSKIGGDVLSGWLKGAKVYTLTLEERATCPKECTLWLECYGNSMQYATRWKAGEALEFKIREEVATLCRGPQKVLIRLHVLGDFYSRGYALMWAGLVAMYPNLNLFGFTAHTPDSDIGQVLAGLRNTYGRRVSIRHSGMTGKWGSFTIDFPTEKKMLGDAIVCLEQRDAMDGTDQKRHCGNCGVCWSTDNAIVFVEH